MQLKQCEHCTVEYEAVGNQRFCSPSCRKAFQATQANCKWASSSMPDSSKWGKGFRRNDIQRMKVSHE